MPNYNAGYDYPIPLDPQTMQPIGGMGYEQAFASQGYTNPQQATKIPWQQRLGSAAKDFMGNRDLALALLANSGRSPYKKGFGEVLGTSMLQADQMKQGREDDAFKRKYMEAQMAAMMRPTAANSNDGMGDYQPGNYTPGSWAKFVRSKDPNDLVRYESPRQETSRPFQNITRTYPDGSTQQGNFDTRTGDFTPTGPLLPPGVKPEADAAGTARGKVAGDLAAKGPRAYEQFKIGIKGLETAMDNTMTGPLAGRIPAMTGAQQTAEGAEAIMAPVLKQLFRESGEGTFTEGDQALLLKMVPNRTDKEEARKFKIQMIDSIVRAKLGMSEQTAEQPPADKPPFSIVGKPPTLDEIRAKYGH